MTNSTEKRMMAISNRSEAFALETLAGLLTVNALRFGVLTVPRYASPKALARSTDANR
jgi:hypothetical protein